jgi:hypothetical protein
MVFQFEEGQLQAWRRQLAPADQNALDELFDQAHYHQAPAAYAGSATPFEFFLLSMLLEEHKQIARLVRLLDPEGDKFQ